MGQICEGSGSLKSYLLVESVCYQNYGSVRSIYGCTNKCNGLHTNGVSTGANAFWSDLEIGWGSPFYASVKHAVTFKIILAGKKGGGGGEINNNFQLIVLLIIVLANN